MPKDVKPLTKKEEKAIKATASAAWRRTQNNSAFAREEKRFLNIAKEVKEKKRADQVKRTEAMAKDVAGYIAKKSREAVTLGGNMPIECLTCEFRVGHLDKCLPCHEFSNYQEKGAVYVG